MATGRIHQVVFRAHRKQLQFLRSQARLVALVGGAGSGKTTAGVIWSLMHAVNWPGSRGMMIARSYPQLKQSLLVELERWARASRLDELWQFNRQDMEVRLPNGSRFWLRSADRPESLLGADLAWLYGDEVALWEEAAFKYAISRLRQPGYPHQAAFTFTPKGRNWAFEVFGKPAPGVETIRCSTRENPFLDPSFVQMLEAQYGNTPFARQEIDGEFVAYEGLVYPQFSEQLHVQLPPPAHRFTTVAAGVDWGYTSPGAIIVIALTHDTDQGGEPASPDHPPASTQSSVAGPTFWVVDEFYARHIPPVGPGECWVSIAKQMRQKWGIEAFYCDPSEPANIAAFSREGLPAAAGDNAVEPGIAQVAALLSAGRLFISPACRNLISEFTRYAYETDSDGNPTGRVLKAFDHALDALRYAVVGLQSRQPPRAFIQAL